MIAALGVAVVLILLASLGPGGFAAGAVTAFLPVPVYVALALWIDRNEPEPRILLVRSFLWGMLVASLLSLLLNGAAEIYLRATLGLSAIVGRQVAIIIASPLIEETTKGIAILLLFRRNRNEFDSVVDGAVYAAMVGLGFAATENVLYYGNAALHGRLAPVFAMRGVAGPFAHPLFTALTGIGFGLARDASSRTGAMKRIVSGFAAAVMLHSLWNASSQAHLFMQAYAILMVPTFLGVLWIVRTSIRREHRLVGETVRRERDAAGLSDEEVAELCRPSSPFFTRGRTEAARRAARRAATELGLACWHAECAGKPHDVRIAALQAACIEACDQWRSTRRI